MRDANTKVDVDHASDRGRPHERAEDSASGRKAEIDRRLQFDRKAEADRQAEADRRAMVDRKDGPGTAVAPDRASGQDTQTENDSRLAERKKATKKRKAFIIVGALALLAALLALLGWRLLKPNGLESGFASGNGRIEAVEIDVAAKAPGRLAEILVNEGDFVTSGQVVARMDTQVLKAQLAEARAELTKAESGIDIAQSQVVQRQSDHVAALAIVTQRRAELNVAGKRLARSKTLAREGAVSIQEYDNDLAGQQGSAASIGVALAQVAAADSSIVTARAQVAGARSGADAVRATIARIEADIEDSNLKSPRDARVQYRVAQPSEVIAPGGKVLNLVDLSDVYMTFFLPNEAAGKIAFGSEIRLVLDAAPQSVVLAHASYVADVAQFTPKTVETASEREKLMFRIRARIDPAVLANSIRKIKTGLPGVAYVRLDPAIAWPDRLALSAPK